MLRTIERKYERSDQSLLMVEKVKDYGSTRNKHDHRTKRRKAESKILTFTNLDSRPIVRKCRKRTGTEDPNVTSMDGSETQKFKIRILNDLNAPKFEVIVMFMLKFR